MKIIYNEEAQKVLKKGIDIAGDLARITIGSKGRNVVISRGNSLIVTNDAKTIIDSIDLKDKGEMTGVKFGKDVVDKTDETAKGGRTAAYIIFQEIVNQGMKYASMGVNVMAMKEGIELAAIDVGNELKKMSKPVKTDDDIKNVATISSESSKIGEIVSESVSKVGKDGIINVEESQTTDLEYEMTDGLKFNRGYISHYMMNNERMESELSDVPVLVTSKKISSYKEIYPIIEAVGNSGKNKLVIISEDIDGDALDKLIINRIKANFVVLGIKAPEYGDKKTAFLEDIALSTGATLISEENGLEYKSDYFGHAHKVISTKDTTTIIGGKGKKSEIADKLNQLANYRNNATVKYDKEKTNERIARLTNRVSVIKVGAATDTEMKRLKQKIEDAVAESKAAIDEGIVAGGGVSLIRCSKMKIPKLSEDQKIGYQIVLKSLESPTRNIAMNAGRDGGVIINEIKNGTGNIGYNSTTDRIVSDLVLDGVIDAVKIIRLGVKNACEGAANVLTMGAANIEDNVKED